MSCERSRIVQTTILRILTIPTRATIRLSSSQPFIQTPTTLRLPRAHPGRSCLQSNLDMHPDYIAELLHPFTCPVSNPCHSELGQRAGEKPAVLSPAQLQSISTYIDILIHWNSRINLTAIRNEEEIVTRHFGESLFAARHLFPPCPESSSVPPALKDLDLDFEVPEAQSPKAEARLADLGSGAGFPGVPIRLWAPNIALTLIESNQKKATFLRELTRALTLTDINIQNARAETLPPSTFDVVTLRAVERLPKVLPIAANLLSPTGRLALLISSSQLESTLSTLPNFSWDHPIPIPQSQSRIILVGSPEPRTPTGGMD
jgi:16S rRNA (guanine527-N7)-methyltransferase